MFEIILTAFSVFGLFTILFTLFRFSQRTFTDAAILYPMYRDEGDAHFTLRALSGLGLPIIVITDDNENTNSLQNEFLYAEFIRYSDFEAFMQERYKRKEP